MSDIELPKPDHWSQMLDEPERAYYTADQLRAAILADREKRAQAAHAYAVHFPDQQREELVHDLDDLLEDMTNYEHTVTPLFATEASKPVQAEAPRMDLMKFYGVDNLSALVDAQHRHIEKLQAKLPRNDQPAFTRVREG